MLFTLTTETENALDIGYLLHKNPNKVHKKKTGFGTSYVFYPTAKQNTCAVTFLLDIDPLALARGNRDKSKDAGLLYDYVNDRPYTANSFMSTAVAQMFGTALNGNCKRKPELVDKIWPIKIFIPTVSVKSGEKFLRRLFEPLKYKVCAQNILLNKKYKNWGNSSYFSVTLEGEHTVQNVLNHLYVLFPVLDNKKHYWVDESEVKKLLDHGGEWLKTHPLKEAVVNRYLINLKSFAKSALEILLDKDEGGADYEKQASQKEQIIEDKISLNKIRMNIIQEKLKEYEVSSVMDLGCGEGEFLKLLLKDKSFTRIAGVDVSAHRLNIAKKRLHWDDLPDKMKSRISLLAGSAVYRDERFSGFDAITLIEVIEHIELNRLSHLERTVFQFASPDIALITTPNVEYNKIFETLNKGQMRHSDHRFEWTREEFENWAKQAAQKYNYQVEFVPIGPIHETCGPPTQMGVFKK